MWQKPAFYEEHNLSSIRCLEAIIIVLSAVMDQNAVSKQSVLLGAVEWFVSVNVSAQLVWAIVSLIEANAKVSWLDYANENVYNVGFDL